MLFSEFGRAMLATNGVQLIRRTEPILLPSGAMSPCSPRTALFSP